MALHREDVLRAAEVIVDRDGLGALTMTALGTELGLKTSSLYNHVESLEALRGELQNRSVEQLGVILRDAAMGKVGERGLRALADTLRSFAKAHPDRYQLAFGEQYDRDSYVAATATATGALDAIIASYGIADEGFELISACFAALHGVITLENSGFLAGGPDLDVLFDMVFAMVAGMVSDASPGERQAS